MSVLSHEYRVARPPKALTFEDSLVMLGKLLSDPGCEIMLGQKITMKDSISMKAFTHPCRALGCKHVQCFDFEVYLHMNRTRLASEYCCPICQQISNPSKIYVDTVFLCLLQILPEDCTVSLMKNGTFEVTLASKPAMEIINVDDEEEEEVEDSVFSSHQKILGTVAELAYIVPFTAAKSRKNHVTLRQLATASLDDVLHLLNVDNAWGINTIPDITELLQSYIKNKRPYACTTDDGLKYCLRQVDGMGEVRAGRIVTHFYNVLNKKLGGFLAHIQSRAFVSGANGVLSSPVVVEFLKKKGKLKLIKPPAPVAPVSVPAPDAPTPVKRAPGSPAGSQSSAYSTHTAHSSASSSASGSAGGSSSSEGAVVDLTAGTIPATTRRKKGKHSTTNSSTTSSDRNSANERVRTNSIISVNSSSGCEDTDAGSSSSVPLTTTTRPATTSYSAPQPLSSHHSHHASPSVSTVSTHISASSQPSTAAGRAKGSSAIMGEGIADVAGPPALTRLGRGPGGGGGGGNTVLDPQRQAVAIDLCDSDTDRSVVALPMAPIAARSPSRTPRSARRGSEGGASGAPSTVSSPASSRQHKRSREQPVVVDDNSVNSGALQVQAHKRPRASTSEAPPLTHDAASVVSDSSGLRSTHSAHSAHSGDSASAPGVSNGARTVTPVVPDRVISQQQSQVLSPVRDHSRRPSTTSPPPRHTTSTTTTHPSARGVIAPGGGNSHIRFSSSPEDVKPSRAELGLPAAHRSGNSSNGNGGKGGNGMAPASLSAVGVNSNGANGGQVPRPAGLSHAPVLVIPPRSRQLQTVAVVSSGASLSSSSGSGGSGDGDSAGGGSIRAATASITFTSRTNNSALSTTPSNNTRPTTAAHTSNNNSTPTTATTTTIPTPKPAVTGPARSRDYTEQDSKRPFSPALTMRHDQRSWLQVKPNYHYGLVNKKERDVDPGSMSGAAHCEANDAGGQVFQPRIAPSRANPLHAQGLGVGLGVAACAWPANAHIEPAAEPGGMAGRSGLSGQKEQSSGVYVNRDGDHVKVWSAASPAPVVHTGSTAVSTSNTTSKTTSTTAAAYPPRTPRQRSDSRERRSRSRDRSYTSYNNSSSNYRNTNYSTTDKPGADRSDRSSRGEGSNGRNSSRGRERSRDRSNTSRNSNNSNSYYSGNTYTGSRYTSSSRGRDNSRDRDRDRDRSGSSRSDRDRGATGGADRDRSRYSSNSYDHTTTSKSNANTSTSYNNANTTAANDASSKPYNPSAGESGGGCRNYSKQSYYKPAAEERGARGASAFPSPATPLPPPLVPCVPVPAAVNGHESAAGNDIKTTIDTNKVSSTNTTNTNRLWRPPVPSTTRTTASTTADTVPSMIQRAPPAVPRPVVSVSNGGSSAGGVSAGGCSGVGTVVNGAGGASSGSSTNSHGATASNSGSVGGNGTVFGKSAVTSTSVSTTITSVPATTATTAPVPLPPKTFAPKLSAGVSNKTINNADTTVGAATSSNSGNCGVSSGGNSGVASPNGKTHIRFDEPSNTSTTPNNSTTKQTTTTLTTSPSTTNALTVSGGLHSKRATSNAKLDTLFGNTTTITTSTNTTSSNTTPNSATSTTTYSQSRVVQLSPPRQNGIGNGSYHGNDGSSSNSWGNSGGPNYNRYNNNSSTYNNSNNNYYRITNNNGTYRNNSNNSNNTYNPTTNTTTTSTASSTNRSSDTVAQLVTKDFIGSDH